MVTRGHVCTVGGMWKNFPPKLLQLLKSGVWHCYGIGSAALGYQQRSTTIEERCQHDPTSAGYGATTFVSTADSCVWSLGHVT